MLSSLCAKGHITHSVPLSLPPTVWHGLHASSGVKCHSARGNETFTYFLNTQIKNIFAFCKAKGKKKIKEKGQTIQIHGKRSSQCLGFIQGAKNLGKCLTMVRQIKRYLYVIIGAISLEDLRKILFNLDHLKFLT